MPLVQFKRCVAIFLSFAFAVVIPPSIKSSTYRRFLISLTVSGSLSFHLCLITPANKRGDGVNPNKALVNHSVSISFVWIFFIQWNRRASFSSAVIRTWRNAFLISPVRLPGRTDLEPVHSTVYSAVVNKCIDIRSAMARHSRLVRRYNMQSSTWYFPLSRERRSCAECRTPSVLRQCVGHAQLFPLQSWITAL